jgi:hypothetical protein
MTTLELVLLAVIYLTLAMIVGKALRRPRL